MYLLIKYIKSVLWRVAKRLSHTEGARCLKVKRSINPTKNVPESILDPRASDFAVFCCTGLVLYLNPYPTAFPYGNGMVLHFYQQQESSMTKTVHKVINKGLKAYV